MAIRAGKALIDFLDTQIAARLPNDMDLIAPDEFGSLFDLNFASVNLANANVQQRLREIRNGNHSTGGSISSYNPRGQQIQLASANNTLPPMDPQHTNEDWAVFVSGNGQYVDVNGTADAAGYHFHNNGVTLGLDKMIRTNLALGFTFDYSGTLASLVNDGQVKVDGGRGGVYGTWFENDNYVEGSCRRRLQPFQNFARQRRAGRRMEPPKVMNSTECSAADTISIARRSGVRPDAERPIHARRDRRLYRKQVVGAASDSQDNRSQRNRS